MIRWRWHQVESPIPEIVLPDDCIPDGVVPGLASMGGYLISYWQPARVAEYEDESRSTG